MGIRAATELERELYPSITRFLQRGGWRVRPLLQIRTGQDQTLIADHLAWK
jgi:hypothetical protein